MARIIIENLPENQKVSDEKVTEVFGEDGYTEEPTTLVDTEHSESGCGCGCAA